MIYGIVKIAKYLLGTDTAARGLAVRPDDTFVVSYPRSGNTWTRFLIANLLFQDRPVSFANIERLIPDAEANSSRYMKRLPSPRVIKSHEYFDHRYKRVIYLVRDPRDVVLSYYNFQRKYRQIADDYPLEQYVGDFIHGRLISADWGTWNENVGSWLVRDGRPNFLLIRYEDMVANSVQELAKIAAFFQIEPTPLRLAAAVERSSARQMRELERTQGSEWVTTKDKRSDIPFVGTATSGVWKTKLSGESVAQIESAWGPLMQRVGYLLTAQLNETSIASDGQASNRLHASLQSGTT